MRNLGLIGGLGPAATVDYYKELVQGHCGEMMILHADRFLALRYVEAGDRAGLAAYFARCLDRLARSGAEIAAISAITPHICIRELEAISPLPLINILDAVIAEIRIRGYRRIGLLGTKFVLESRMFGMLDEFEVVLPPDIQQVHDIYMRFVSNDCSGRDAIIDIARRMAVDGIVLAGTDFSVAFNEANTPFPHIDCLKVHVQAILRALS